jgi:hypothetical protein
VEALTALLLGWLILALTLGTLARQRTVQRRMAHRAEALEALRTTRHVLGEELRRASPRHTQAGPDSVALRAYRGMALVCPVGSDPRTLVVGYRGIRVPDPAKDSVELVDGDGSTVTFALVDRTSGGPVCGDAPDLAGERWILSGPAPGGTVVARIFERGSYHLAERALRYRRGGAGRQPLTPEVLETPLSGFVVGGAGFLGVRAYVRSGTESPDSLALSIPWAR